MHQCRCIHQCFASLNLCWPRCACLPARAPQHGRPVTDGMLGSCILSCQPALLHLSCLFPASFLLLSCPIPCTSPASSPAGTVPPHPLTAGPHTSTSSRTSTLLQQQQMVGQRQHMPHQQRHQDPMHCQPCSSPQKACCITVTLTQPRLMQQTRAAGCWSTCRRQMSLRPTGSTETRGAMTWCRTWSGRASCCGR